MHKAVHLTWIYILCLAFAFAIAVAILPSVSENFAFNARLMSGALLCISAVIFALIVIFCARIFLRKKREDKE